MAEEDQGKAGRPEHHPTAEQRLRVERYTAASMTQKQIAIAIGISGPTLRKHYPDELAHGPARRYAALVDLMFESAKAGNASIQKRLEQIVSATMAQQGFVGTGAGAPDEEASSGAASPRRRVGKKEQADEDASTAGTGTDWGNDLVPRVIQ